MCMSVLACCGMTFMCMSVLACCGMTFMCMSVLACCGMTFMWGVDLDFLATLKYVSQDIHVLGSIPFLMVL